MLGQYKSHNIPNSIERKISGQQSLSMSMSKDWMHQLEIKWKNVLKNGILHSANCKSKYRLKVRCWNTLTLEFFLDFSFLFLNLSTLITELFIKYTSLFIMNVSYHKCLGFLFHPPPACIWGRYFAPITLSFLDTVVYIIVNKRIPYI